jgi:hypothetical protein
MGIPGAGLMMANGFTVAQMVDLVRAGLDRNSRARGCWRRRTHDRGRAAADHRGGGQVLVERRGGTYGDDAQIFLVFNNPNKLASTFPTQITSAEHSCHNVHRMLGIGGLGSLVASVPAASRSVGSLVLAGRVKKRRIEQAVGANHVARKAVKLAISDAVSSLRSFAMMRRQRYIDAVDRAKLARVAMNKIRTATSSV